MTPLLVLLNGFSGQALGSRPLQVFSDRERLLLIFGQRLFGWAERVFLGLLGYDFTSGASGEARFTASGSQRGRLVLRARPTT
jgi:hypothetical protein